MKKALLRVLFSFLVLSAGVFYSVYVAMAEARIALHYAILLASILVSWRMQPNRDELRKETEELSEFFRTLKFCGVSGLCISVVIFLFGYIFYVLYDWNPVFEVTAIGYVFFIFFCMSVICALMGNIHKPDQEDWI